VTISHEHNYAHNYMPKGRWVLCCDLCSKRNTLYSSAKSLKIS